MYLFRCLRIATQRGANGETSADRFSDLQVYAISGWEFCDNPRIASTIVAQ